MNTVIVFINDRFVLTAWQHEKNVILIGNEEFCERFFTSFRMTNFFSMTNSPWPPVRTHLQSKKPPIKGGQSAVLIQRENKFPPLQSMATVSGNLFRCNFLTDSQPKSS